MAWDDDKSTATDPNNPTSDEQLTADEWDNHVNEGHWDASNLNLGQNGSGDPILTDPQNNDNTVLQYDRSAGEWAIPTVSTDELNSADYYIDTSDDAQTVFDNAEVGATIVFLPGTHDVDDLDISRDGVRVIGYGDVSELKLSARSLNNLERVLDVSGDNVTVRGIKVNGNRSNHTGTETVNQEGINFDSKNGTVTNVTVVNSPGDGIDLDSDATGAEVVDSYIKNCGGFGIHNSGVNETRIANNRVLDCGFTHSRAGIDQFNTAENTAITGNVVKNSRDCIRVNGTGATVTGNQVINDGVYGIFYDGSDATINGNHCIDSSITIESEGVTVTGNTVQNGQIRTEAADFCISGNRVTGPGSQEAIEARPGSQTQMDGVISNNICNGNGAQNAIILVDSTDITVTSNICRNTTGVSIAEQSAGDNAIIGNDIDSGLSVGATTITRNNSPEQDVHRNLSDGNGTGIITIPLDKAYTNKPTVSVISGYKDVTGWEFNDTSGSGVFDELQLEVTTNTTGVGVAVDT